MQEVDHYKTKSCRRTTVDTKKEHTGSRNAAVGTTIKNEINVLVVGVIRHGNTFSLHHDTIFWHGLGNIP